MEKNRPNMHAYTDVMMKKAHLDWEMECLHTKIKCKNEENSKLENQISERKNELEKLRKSVKASCEKEEKVKNNINMLRNSRTISEGLLMSMKQQLRILEEKRNETRNARKNIIEKYSRLFASHTKIYSNLPWVKKINELKISIQSRKIHLDILKLEYTSVKTKTSLFHRIQEQRKVVAITQLAKCLSARNNLQKEVEDLFSKQKDFQTKIKLLEEDKVKLQEKIDLKVKEALDKARDRVVKKHVGESTNEKHKTVTVTPDVVTPFGANMKPNNESIFSRLGLSVPLSMKRLITPSSRDVRRVNSLMEEQSKTNNALITEQFNAVKKKSFTSEVQKDKQTMEERRRVLESAQALKDLPKKKDVLATEKFNKIEERSFTSEEKKKQMLEGMSPSPSQSLKRPSTSLSKISEKIPHLMEVTDNNKIPASDNVCLDQDEVQPSEEMESISNNEKTEVTQPVTASEPTRTNNLTIQTEEIDNKRSADQTVNKNKVKKDSKSESSVQLPENLKSYIPGNDKNVVEPEQSLGDNENELSSNLPKKHVKLANVSPEIPTGKEMQPQKQIMEHIDTPEQLTQGKNMINEVEMNDSNLSMLDNISVVSSSFTNENRNQMTKSPDFLNQIPQGYCFSPLYSPSKADSISEISSVKGAQASAKSPTNNFPISTSIASPLFPIDAQSTAGPTSDFSSFFGTSSPKKSENSSKNFFQLFG